MTRKFNEQEQNRRLKLEKLKLNKQNPFRINKVERTHTIKQLQEKYQSYNRDELGQLSQDDTIIAGRIKYKRLKGKAGFATIQDQSGELQIYVREDIVKNDLFTVFNDLDLGDFISLSGTMMRTKSNELTIRVKHLQLISKSVKVLPEKYHGLTNIEERYRRRYLDLICNPEVKEIFIDRAKVFELIRNYLNNLGFLEVETPILHSILGGAAAKPFITYHNAIGHNFYLRIAPELYLKRLIVGGFEKVYEIGRLFRNEGVSPRHNPEFSTIEVYQAYANMETMMDLTENLINYLVIAIVKSDEIEYEGNKINFKSPWKRIRMVDAIKEITKIDFSSINKFKEAKDIAKKFGLKLEKHHTSVGHIINLFFEQFVEEKLIQPTFVYDYPVVVSPLAKANEKDDRFAERFELFIGAREYANAYSELNDPIVQEERFNQQLKERDLGNEEANEMDIDFIEALEYGMPPTGGLGIGLDRLMMLLKNQKAIKDVILFPHLAPRSK